MSLLLCPTVFYGLTHSILLGQRAIPEEHGVIIQLEENDEMFLWLRSKRGQMGI